MFHVLLTPMRLWVICLFLLVWLTASAVAAQEQGWGLLGDEATLQVLTVDHTGREHWSTFWWVVVDGQLYLRLGRQGAARIEGNRNKPFVSVKIGGQRFDDVRVVAAPEKTEAVAEAMAKKYRLDLLIRYFPHPLTARLERGV
ncbi:MAG: hypothetical protein ACRERD_14230 [Candidatus Binatia bacterium]